MRIRTLFSIIVLVAVQMAAVFAADQNPPPCQEPWTCYPDPELSATPPEGPTEICPTDTQTWTATQQITKGKKSRCDEEKEYGLKNIVWYWDISGPGAVPGMDSGEGLQAYWSPTQGTVGTPGDYTITWNGYADKDDSDCTGRVTAATATFNFKILDNTPTITSSPVQICPGTTGDVVFTLTNNTKCPRTVKWNLGVGAGIAEVTIAPPLSGTVVVPANYNAQVTAKCTASATSPGGPKIIVFTSDGGNKNETVTVPPPAGTFTWDVSGCQKASPNSRVRLPFHFVNPGVCCDDLSYTITSNEPKITLTGAVTGDRRKCPGDRPSRFAIYATPAADLKKGQYILTAVLKSRGVVVDTQTACVEVAVCEASTAVHKEELKLVFGEGWTTPIKKNWDKIINLLDRIPGLKAKPKAPELSGKLTFTTGEECCPGNLNPTPYRETEGNGEVKIGIDLANDFGLNVPGINVSLPGGYKITANVRAGIFGTASPEFKASGKVKDHQGECKNCTEYNTTLSLGLKLKLEAGGKAKATLESPGNAPRKLEVNLTGGAELEGVFTGAGNIYSGDCNKADDYKFCAGPIKLSWSFTKFKIWFFEVNIKGEKTLLESTCP